jgi:hypothetical protein
VPFSWAARPPLLAISRCFSGDIDANPRRSLRSPLFTAEPPASGHYSKNAQPIDIKVCAPEARSFDIANLLISNGLVISQILEVIAAVQ